MNTTPYILRGMKVLIYNLKGGTARKVVYMMWIFMFTEGRTAKFPLLQNMMDLKNYRHTGEKKKVTSNSRVDFQYSRISLPKNLFP